VLDPIVEPVVFIPEPDHPSGELATPGDHNRLLFALAILKRVPCFDLSSSVAPAIPSGP
jgi:hypothetical protein